MSGDTPAGGADRRTSGTEVFEYALIRVVPRVERGEAINAGVILYCKGHRYLCTRIELDEARLRALDPRADLDVVRAALHAFEKACAEGPLAGRPLGERFRWLTAPRSTVVQPGPVHSGLTADPDAELTHLFDTLVRALPPPGAGGARGCREKNERLRSQNDWIKIL